MNPLAVKRPRTISLNSSFTETFAFDFGGLPYEFEVSGLTIKTFSLKIPFFGITVKFFSMQALFPIILCLVL